MYIESFELKSFCVNSSEESSNAELKLLHSTLFFFLIQDIKKKFVHRIHLLDYNGDVLVL